MRTTQNATGFSHESPTTTTHHHPPPAHPPPPTTTTHPPTTQRNHKTVPGADACASCTCALLEVFRPAFAASGLLIDAANPSAYPVKRASDLTAACATRYLSQITAAGANATTIAGLADCDFSTAATLPPCVVAALSEGEGEGGAAADDSMASMANNGTMANGTMANGTMANGTTLNGTDADDSAMNVTAAAGAAEDDSAAGCPIPTTTALNFSGVAAGCDSSPGQCGPCTCALVEVFLPAFESERLLISDAETPAAYNATKAAGLVATCATDFLPQMTAAGVNASAVAALQGCDYTSAATLPACLVTLLSAPGGGANATNATTIAVSSATSAAATAALPVGRAAASALGAAAAAVLAAALL